MIDIISYQLETRSAGIPTEEPHKQTAAKYLNKLLGRHYNSGDFWLYMKKALLRKFHVRAQYLESNHLV